MKKQVIIGAVIFSLSVAGCSVLKPEPQQINLNDYLSYEISGYDGDGRIDSSIDLEGVLDDYENLEECNLSTLRNLIQGSWTQNYDLSNGDDVRFVWTVYPSTLEEEYNVVFDYDDVEITVDHLEAKPAFDPFDYMEVSYSGIAPYGTISISSASTPIGTVNYSASSSSGLRNGDVITVTAYNSTDGDLEYLADDCGYQLTGDTIDFTLDGFDEYLSSISDIPDDTVAMLEEQAINTFYAEEYCNWDVGSVVNSISLDGMYLLTMRENSNAYDSYNKLFVILAVNSSNSTVSDVEYYYYVGYSNIVLLNDGTVSLNVSNYQVPYGDWFFGDLYGNAFVVENDDHYYVGYQNLDDFYAHEIQNNLVNYTYETTYE